MSEVYRQPEIPYADYPLLFGGDMPPGFEVRHAANISFAEQMIPPTAEGYSDFDRLVIGACANALTATDHRLGRNTGELGTMCTQDKDGLWLTLPTFYHNGDGTRLAMLGTRSYMDFVNSHEQENSPYLDRRTELASMATAAFDDIVFGVYQRVGDELASAAIAEEYLRAAGVDEDFTQDVVIAIHASIFDEITNRQRYNPALGAEPVQRASLIGDTWAAGTPQSSAIVFPLVAENLWKADSGFTGRQFQALRNAALNQYIYVAPWYGDKLSDFFELAQAHPEALHFFGQSVAGNKVFLLEKHNYESLGDARIDQLMQPGKEQNARLQSMIGRSVLNRAMSVAQGYHCALSYAYAHTQGDARRPFAMLETDASPEAISQIILAGNSEQQLQRPISALSFFRAYKAVHNIT